MLSAEAIPDDLDMGIWSDAGYPVWLPKAFYPTRSEAKMFAVREMDGEFIHVRVRTRWMRLIDISPEPLYSVCEKADEGAFECWEVS